MTPSLVLLGGYLVTGLPVEMKGELHGAVSCVIDAWNTYDTDASRKCYAESAVAVWNGKAIGATAPALIALARECSSSQRPDPPQ
jgi:hypothetical protein